jgi:hypothetical protein
MFFETIIEEKTVDEIMSVIQHNRNFLEDKSNLTYTVNGFQSQNIVDLFTDSLKKSMLSNNCFYKDIFYIHYIEYKNGGYQKEHNHIITETYSFILYLNNAVGDTVFSKNNIRINPIKGKLIIFDSELDHYGEESTNKKILVGAIKSKEKYG